MFVLNLSVQFMFQIMGGVVTAAGLNGLDMYPDTPIANNISRVPDTLSMAMAPLEML